MAWHIARLPGGRIALATQYGHLRAATVTDGYAGRARDGLRRVLDIVIRADVCLTVTV